MALLLGASAQGADARGLSSATKALLDRVGAEASATDGRRMAPSAKSESDMVRMFMRYNHISALDSVEAVGGIAVTLPSDWLATVSLPAGEIEHIGSIAQVDYLEVGGEVTLLTDRVRYYASVDGVQDGTRTGGVTYTGKGVVLGVIDAGLEYNHLNFRDADGNNRIKRIWVQTSSLGKHPEKFDYGVEYSSPEQIAALTCDTRETYHATHVMGIAAGSDMKSGYNGMAPDTELVYVRFGGTAQIADAIQYIFDYADEVDKPCVINMSLGAHQGPHDG
ncbi:MAG: S8 family serine peptidase, partial [Muribaculaceae bacterium]|nr:S8 family serine peptidase [Muribaculaceae bacterium]